MADYDIRVTPTHPDSEYWGGKGCYLSASFIDRRLKECSDLELRVLLYIQRHGQLMIACPSHPGELAAIIERLCDEDIIRQVPKIRRTTERIEYEGIEGQRSYAEVARRLNAPKKSTRDDFIKEPGHTEEEWMRLKLRLGNKCLRCGADGAVLTLARDHVVPISEGGSDDICNIQPLCKACNSWKGSRTIDFRPVEADDSPEAEPGIVLPT